MGPVLSVAYKNHTVSATDETISMRLFADDCPIYRETNDSNDHTQLREGVASIYNLCERWKMKLNRKKKCLL